MVYEYDDGSTKGGVAKKKYGGTVHKLSILRGSRYAGSAVRLAWACNRPTSNARHLQALEGKCPLRAVGTTVGRLRHSMPRRRPPQSWRKFCAMT